MLKQALNGLGRKREEAVFVGDRDSDRLAAEAAGIQFVWAADFFFSP